MARISKTQRCLDLIAYLVARRMPATVDAIMEDVPAYAEKWATCDATQQATAKRTFERDKEELRRLGIPLQTVRYTINFGAEVVEGYRIRRRDFYLPYLRLIAGEAAAGAAAPGPGSPGGTVEIGEADAHLALEALRQVSELPSFPLAEEASSAFRKLAFDLDPAALSVPDSPVLFVERPGADELVDGLRLLSDALLARKRVRFRYRGIYRDEVTERDVAPYGLLFQHAHWYLVAHDAGRDGIRVFRVGRMEEVAANTRAPNDPDYEVPDDFRLDAYAGREAWELGGEDEEPIRAEVLFRFPASLLAERNRHGELVERRADGSAVRAFRVAQVQPFLRWLLGLEGDAGILSPPELADELRAMAADVAAVHRSAGAGEADDA